MEMTAGTLYLVGTPIGNLDDMTYRAVEVLSRVDVIAAEDTRNTLRLLNHFEIKNTLVSYHEHNQKQRGPELLAQLQQGRMVALVTDAGMPAVSDPGEGLVRLCHEAGVPVSPVPGACAAICAVAASGQDTSHFYFEGFLPPTGRERRERLAAVAEMPCTVILYEAPHKLQGTLADLLDTVGDRSVTLAREITKRYEEVERTTLRQAVERYSAAEPRGEFVLVLEGGAQQKQGWSDEALSQLLQELQRKGMRPKEAVREVVARTGEKKNRVYELSLRKITSAEDGPATR
ncbi:MAG: 16S rRNA (cytidine(1402)-2'-O)-methyltransferase [Eubacteriales bacterium]|jgi:16S rRNA (cytidine1402-2'-O)-methyltransferase